MTLNTPLLWVALPLVVAVIAGLFYQRITLSIILTSATALSLSLLAVFFPEDLTISLGPLLLRFDESLGILGRQITVAYEMMPFIGLIFAMTGLWILSSGLPGTPIFLRPISLVITALLTAALGVEPFLYAALLIQTAVLVSIPMLAPVRKSTHAGILRYLSFETLAMPLILLAGWLLTGVETLPPESVRVGQTTIILGLGFALWLGVFPFHSWVPMVSQHSHAIAVSFLLFILPTSILIFALNFFNRYTFLRELPNLDATLRLFGTLMIVLGGIWTAIQDNLKRAFGFSVLTETGFSLLVIGLIPQGGLNWLMILFPVRALGFWLWGYALTLIEAHVGSLNFKSIQGFGRNYPILSAGLLAAQFSIAGLPLLASFPIKMAMLTALLETGSPLGVWSFIGNLGLFLFTLRLLSFLITPQTETESGNWTRREKVIEYLPILIMLLTLVILGLFPHLILGGITNTLTTFIHLQ